MQQNEKQDTADYSKLSKIVADSENLTKTLSSQVAAQKHRSDVAVLETDAENNGTRASLDVLMRMLNDPTELTEIRELARSEMLRVKIFWSTADKTVGQEINWVGADGKPKPETALTTCELLSELKTHKDWKVRARAAQLLVAHADVGVPEGLLKAIESDSQLQVMRDAMHSFTTLTGFKSPDVFGLPFIDSWWQAHAEETKKKLQKSACLP